jgi:hypothetical protein
MGKLSTGIAVVAAIALVGFGLVASSPPADRR